MAQKSESAVSLYEVLLYLRNFFPGERWKLNEEPIQAGGVELPGLEEGDYYLVEGSRRNDGLHIYGAGDLVGDELTGYITECRIPAALVAIHEEINYWQQQNADAVTSPYQSESFGGYSYTKANGNGGSEAATNWQTAFSSRLRIWRKI